MDLVPTDYRKHLQQMFLLQRYGMVMLAYVALAALITLGFKNTSNAYESRIEVLEKKKAISSHLRGILRGLENDRLQLAERRQVLEKLRGGALAEDMFVSIDRALNGKNVWFKNWKFTRAGSKTRKPDKGVSTGYFIVIPESDRGRQKDKEAWRIETHMEVSGQATDHEALSNFVRRVLQQPQIDDVRILSTQQRVNADNTVVDFRLVILVNSGYASS